MDEAVDRAIDRVARRQGGFIKREQLVRLGLTVHQIEYRIRIGRLIPVYRGVYAVGHLPRLPVDRAHGALLACGPTAVLSHRSAASLWGFYADWRLPFEVTVAEDRRPRGITVHVSQTLTRGDIKTQLGVRTTSRARTVFDLAPRLTDGELRRFVDDCQIHHHLKADDLSELARRLPHAPAAGRIKQLLSGGHNPTRSELEALFRDVHARRDLPMPRFNVIVDGVEADVYFPDHGVIVELDGRRFHSDPRTFESDRRRDRNHLRNGKPTVRLTWDAMTLDPDGEAELLQDVLNRYG